MNNTVAEVEFYTWGGQGVATAILGGTHTHTHTHTLEVIGSLCL